MGLPVGHPDDEDVVELVHAVYLGQQLVDHRVVDAAGVTGLREERQTKVRKDFTIMEKAHTSFTWEPRALQMASISSKMIMWRPELGPSLRSSSSASSNSRRMLASLSPTYLIIIIIIIIIMVMSYLSRI